MTREPIDLSPGSDVIILINSLINRKSWCDYCKIVNII